MEEKNRIKGLRLIIAAVALVFVAFVIIRIIFDEGKKFSPSFVDSATLIFGLWIIIILFSLTFLFIFVRNLIKLYYDKSKYYKGGRFKNKLVFFFIAFSIVPTLLLFFLATDMINKGIEKWFSLDVESIISEVTTVEESYYNKAREELNHYSKNIGEMIMAKKMYSKSNTIFLYTKVKQKMREYKLDVVNIYRDKTELMSLLQATVPLQEYKDLPFEIIYKGLSATPFIYPDQLKDGLLIRSGIHFNIKKTGEKILVIIGRYYSGKYVKSLNSLKNKAKNYLELKKIKDHVKTTYILLFVFITILIIFAASWLGKYLAKGITIPIEKLVTAASEITKGNLDVKIDHDSKDEFNLLITEFNKMAKDLSLNRTKLNKRTIELRQRRSMNETILKNITSGVIAISSTGEIIDINPEARRMLGLGDDEILKAPYSKIFANNLFADIKSSIDSSFSSKFKTFEKEVDIKIKGKILNLAMRITQIRNPINNTSSGILVVFTELTQLIKAQRVMVWREVAKRIAHEIKNPLTPIQISTQRILRAFELSDDKFRKVVEDSIKIVMQEVDSIKKLAEEFSNFARLPELKFTKGDVNLILDKLISVYTSIYDQVEFRVNLDVNLPIIMKIDTEQFKRILVNIIDNAIESMNKAGIVDISTSFNKDTQFVRIEIADNGPGINDEDKQKLFIPYFSKKSSGTGLGLAISYKIIEEHNGVISVVDNTPQGTRFIIETPV